MRHTLLIFAVLLCGCEKVSTDRAGAMIVERDSRPAFVLDASKPFVVELGRGSGMRGLDVVRIDGTGSVEVHRITRNGGVERAGVRLTPADVSGWSTWSIRTG